MTKHFEYARRKRELLDKHGPIMNPADYERAIAEIVEELRI